MWWNGFQDIQDVQGHFSCRHGVCPRAGSEVGLGHPGLVSLLHLTAGQHNLSESSWQFMIMHHCRCIVTLKEIEYGYFQKSSHLGHLCEYVSNFHFISSPGWLHIHIHRVSVKQGMPTSPAQTRGDAELGWSRPIAEVQAGRQQSRTWGLVQNQRLLKMDGYIAYIYIYWSANTQSISWKRHLQRFSTIRRVVEKGGWLYECFKPVI